MRSDPFFLLTVGFLFTILIGALIAARSTFCARWSNRQANREWALGFPPWLAETLSLWTMNIAAVMSVLVPDFLSELALSIWLLIAAVLYWYAAWIIGEEPA